MKRAIALPTTAVLLLCSASFAQNPTSQVKKLPASETSRAILQEDWEKEQQFRKLMLEKNRREHSDPSGHVRPELWNEGVAHMKRMKVVSHIGPVPNESPDKK
jgi:hypothetical protein